MTGVANKETHSVRIVNQSLNIASQCIFFVLLKMYSFRCWVAEDARSPWSLSCANAVDGDLNPRRKEVQLYCFLLWKSGDNASPMRTSMTYPRTRWPSGSRCPRKQFAPVLWETGFLSCFGRFFCVFNNPAVAKILYVPRVEFMLRYVEAFVYLFRVQRLLKSNRLTTIGEQVFGRISRPHFRQIYKAK